MQCSGVGSTNYNIAINSPLPSRGAILKNKHNKLQLSRVLSTFDMGSAVTIDTQYTGVFGHEEADVTVISYVLQADGEGNNVVRVLCDDTDVFVLHVFWMWRNQLVDKCQMQMERWDGTVLNINQTCTKLGSKCHKLFGMHVLTGLAIFRRIAPTCVFMCPIYFLCQSEDECGNLHKRSQHVDDEEYKKMATRRSMKLWMPTVLLIENERINQRSFLAFIIVI